MKVDICKLYSDFWNESPIYKHENPKDILVTWSGIELQQFVEFALKQAIGAETENWEALHKQNVSQRSEQLAIAALDKIAHPIKYLQSEAEKDGAKLDGYMAIQITQDANFYQEIADKALKAIANCR